MCTVLTCLWFLSSFAFVGVVLDVFVLLVFLGGGMLFKMFVFVVSKICCENDLVEVFPGFFTLLVRVRVGSAVAEVDGGAVCGIDHKSGFGQLFFCKVCRYGPHVQRHSVVIVQL